jgi:hypothetical protein
MPGFVGTHCETDIAVCEEGENNVLLNIVYKVLKQIINYLKEMNGVSMVANVLRGQDWHFYASAQWDGREPYVMLKLMIVSRHLVKTEACASINWPVINAPV